MTERRVAVEIVDAIIADLTSRRGLRQEWDSIDQKTKDEIVATWMDFAEEKIRENFSK